MGSFGRPFGPVWNAFGYTFDRFVSLGPLWLHFGCLFLSFCTVWPLSWSVLGYIPCFWRRNLPNTAKLILGIKFLIKCYLLFCLPLGPLAELLPQATERRAVKRNVRLESSYRVRGSKFGSAESRSVNNFRPDVIYCFLGTTITGSSTPTPSCEKSKF